MKEVSARYVYGLSATPTRQDGRHPIVFLQCGPIRYLVAAREQAGKHSFSHFIIPRFTAYRTAVSEERGIAALYSELAADERRNAMIVKDAKAALAEGRSPILLTERREHVERLAALLRPICANVVTLYGSASSKQRKAALDSLQAIPPSEPLLVVATGKYVGEGFDCPRLDTRHPAADHSRGMEGYRGTVRGALAPQLSRKDRGTGLRLRGRPCAGVGANVPESAVIEPLSRFRRYADVLPYYRNVVREGIRYAAG